MRKEFNITAEQQAICYANIMVLMQEGEITKEGIIIKCNEEKVNEVLFEKEYTEEELTILRNNYVYCLSELMEEARKDSFDITEKFLNIMMIITIAIDKRINEGRYLKEIK